MTIAATKAKYREIAGEAGDVDFSGKLLDLTIGVVIGAESTLAFGHWKKRALARLSISLSSPQTLYRFGDWHPIADYQPERTRRT